MNPSGLFRTDNIFTGIAALLLVALAGTAAAQETRYISDQILVPVRSGAGGEYRILNKGLPSGTALTQFELSEDGVWAEIETRGGTRGWVRAQYLQSEPPAALLLAELKEKLKAAESDRDKLRATLSATKSEASEAGGELEELRLNLANTEQELVEIKRVSAAAIELDIQNRTLVTDLETLRAEAELLRLENVRLQERSNNNQIIDGAIAVLLGVIITLIAPRLAPRKRRNDGWA